MKYVFHPAALTEYSAAVEFYAKRRVELAQAFIKERVTEKRSDG